MTPEAAAAWVQAIGSVLAIGVAVFLAEREAKLRRLEREQDAKEDIEKEHAQRARFIIHLGAQLVRFDDIVGEIIAQYPYMDWHWPANPDGEGVLGPPGGEQWDDYDHWITTSSLRVRYELLGRLDAFASLPITAWPDPEIALMFQDYMNRLRPTLEVIREGFSPATVTVQTNHPMEDLAAHTSTMLEQLIFLKDDSPTAAYKLYTLAAIEIEEAKKLSIDHRYPNRKALDIDLETKKAAFIERKRIIDNLEISEAQLP